MPQSLLPRSHKEELAVVILRGEEVAVPEDLAVKAKVAEEGEDAAVHAAVAVVIEKESNLSLIARS